jgi:antitoxin component of MazEF toxin-antitoxin module
MTVTPIDPGNRIQLPADWMQALGLHDLVTLERTNEGILIRPCPRATWEEIFATKLVIGSAPPSQHEDSEELTGDDFLF